MNKPATKNASAIEQLLEQPYWVIDPLPRRVPADSPGQFFAVERYFLRPTQKQDLAEHFVRLVLKLNCWFDIRLFHPESDLEEPAPEPERIASQLRACAMAQGPDNLYLLLSGEDAMLTLSSDDLNMTLYHPSESLMELVRPLAAAEGLFVWEP